MGSHHSAKKPAPVVTPKPAVKPTPKPKPKPAPKPLATPPAPIVNYHAPAVTYQDGSQVQFDNGGVASNQDIVAATAASDMAAKAANPEVAAGSEAIKVADAVESQFSVAPPPIPASYVPPPPPSSDVPPVPTMPSPITSATPYPDANLPAGVAKTEDVPKRRRGRASLSIPFAGTSGFTSGGVFIPYF
jgi:hypothetical protein